MPVDVGLPKEGMIYQRAQYAKGGIGAKYWDYRDRWAFRFIRGERILDVGCGEGISLEKLVRQLPSKSIWGIEPEPENVAICRRRQLPVIQGSVFTLPFPDGSFECVLFFEVIEHLETPERAIQEIARILQPRGRLILIFPNDRMFKLTRLMLGMVKEAFYDPGHVMQWTPGKMRSLLRQHRLTVVAAHNLPFYLWPISLHHLVIAENA